MTRRILLTILEYLLNGMLVMILVTCSWAIRSGQEYKFRGTPDGANPQGALVSDGAGNFYGTTVSGGNVRLNDYACGSPGATCGTVFKMFRSQSGRWAETVLYKFTGAPDGAAPQGKLILDPQGNLYGTATLGGIAGCYCGTVFKLAPNQDGSWTESTLYNFRSGTDASGPNSGVIIDAQGNLYGTTVSGGCNPLCNGTVFKLAPSQSGSWTESILYTFSGGEDGYSPGAVVLDAEGSLYGTTTYGGVTQPLCGGSQGCGTVFELTLSQSGSWTKRTLYSFTDGLDGGYPVSGLTFDSIGNLYGETAYGGSLACPQIGCGVIFSLTPGLGGDWQYSVVHTFNGLNGQKGKYPYGGLVFDSTGTLYGTTSSGGDLECGSGYGCGTIFKLSPAGGGHFNFKIIVEFDGIHGSGPAAGVIVDAVGNVYGTASSGGDLNCSAPYGCGVLFGTKR